MTDRQTERALGIRGINILDFLIQGHPVLKSVPSAFHNIYDDVDRTMRLCQGFYPVTHCTF